MSIVCRCGRYDLGEDTSLILNDTQHESLAVPDGFCGPVVSHSLRDALATIAVQARTIEGIGQECNDFEAELGAADEQLAELGGMLREALKFLPTPLHKRVKALLCPNVPKEPGEV